MRAVVLCEGARARVRGRARRRRTGVVGSWGGAPGCDGACLRQLHWVTRRRRHVTAADGQRRRQRSAQPGQREAKKQSKAHKDAAPAPSPTRRSTDRRRYGNKSMAASQHRPPARQCVAPSILRSPGSRAPIAGCRAHQRPALTRSLARHLIYVRAPSTISSTRYCLLCFCSLIALRFCSLFCFLAVPALHCTSDCTPALHSPAPARTRPVAHAPARTDSSETAGCSCIVLAVCSRSRSCDCCTRPRLTPLCSYHALLNSRCPPLPPSSWRNHSPLRTAIPPCPTNPRLPPLAGRIRSSGGTS